MGKARLPGKILTVVIRDDSPMFQAGDSPTYRSVQIYLTVEQREKMALRYLGQIGKTDEYEAISRVFIEPERDPESTEVER